MTEPFRERNEPLDLSGEPSREIGEPTRQRGEPTRQRVEQTRQRTAPQIYGPPLGLSPWTAPGEPTRQRITPPRQRIDQLNYRSDLEEPANDRELRLYVEAQTRSLPEAQQENQGMHTFGPGEQLIHLSTQEELNDSDEFTANS